MDYDGYIGCQEAHYVLLQHTIIPDLLCQLSERHQQHLLPEATTRYLEQQLDEMYVDVIMAGGRSHCFVALVRESKNFIIQEFVAIL